MFLNQKFINYLKITVTIIITIFTPYILAILIAYFWVILVLLVLLLFLFHRYITKKFAIKNIADEVIYLSTQDNWNISLHHHIPKELNPNYLPVILCHGLMANKYSVDLDEEHSIAFFLKEKGIEVFVAELRGVGISYHDSKKSKDYNFDSIVNFDLPAILEKVKIITGKNKINWIGHSMGGAAMHAYLGLEEKDNTMVNSIVSIGVPGRLDHFPSNNHRKVLSNFYHFVTIFFDTKFVSRLLTPIMNWAPKFLHEIAYSKENTDRIVAQKLMYNGFENISFGLTKQYAYWLKTKEEYSMDNKINYRECLNKINIPVFLIAGVKDEVATFENVSYAYEKIPSKNKKMLIVSRENHSSVDHDHISILNGKNTKREIFPLIYDWLLEYGKNA